MLYCEILLAGKHYKMDDSAVWTGGDRDMRDLLNAMRGEWTPSEPHPAKPTLRTLREMGVPFRVIEENPAPIVAGRIY